MSGAPGQTASITVDNCDQEPIHIPGSIQPHAVLLVLQDDYVVQCSENASELLALEGSVTETVLGRRVDAVLGANIGGSLLTDKSMDGKSMDGRRIRSSRTTLPGGRVVDVTAVEQDPDADAASRMRIVQIEPVVASDDAEASFADAVTDAVFRIQLAGSSDIVIEEACAFVKLLTGFDRVMGYRFEPDDHGVVIAEHRRADLEPFLGLHYPASDIPAQARHLYLEHWLRLIPDARYRPVPLVPTLLPSGKPLDLSAVTSRSVSPIHCEYLTNMSVVASMSISLVVGGRLWGLIACHHYRGPKLPSTPVREACEFIALTASVMLGSRLVEERAANALQMESVRSRLAEQLARSDDLTTGLTGEPQLLLDLVDAQGAAIVFAGVATLIGSTPDEETVARLVDLIGEAHVGAVVATDNARVGYPVLTRHEDTAAGFLAMPISSLQRNYVVWFRPQWLHDVQWAGEPMKAVQQAPERRLAPRTSFEAWTERVEGRSRPWSPEQVTTVEALRAVIANHIVKTVEQLARLNAELVRSNAELDAFAYVAAHDLQEPLRGLANYATFLVEDYADVLDDEGRHRLEMMTKLAGRMSGLVRSLLEHARVGRSEPEIETVRLRSLVEDVRELMSSRLTSGGAELVLMTDDEIRVDRGMIGHVLLNLISNAIKYNNSSEPRVEVGTIPLVRTQRGLALVPRSLIAEVEQVVVFVRDNGIGIAADRIEEIFRVFRRLHGPQEYGGGTGVGLTIARRIVQRHGGVLWAESEDGCGSTFYFSTGAVE